MANLESQRWRMTESEYLEWYREEINDWEVSPEYLDDIRYQFQSWKKTMETIDKAFEVININHVIRIYKEGGICQKYSHNCLNDINYWYNYYNEVIEKMFEVFN